MRRLAMGPVTMACLGMAFGAWASAAKPAAVPERRAAHATTARAVPTHRVRITRALRGGDKELAPGTYEVRLAQDTQGAWIELAKDGTVAVRELAVKPKKQPKGGGHRAWTAIDHRQEMMLRVYYHEGRDLYLAAFELGK